MDVARGVAVLGVLLMNIWAFAGPQAFFDYPLAIAGRSGAPVATWAVVHTLFEGTQRTLLSLLFGAGAALVIERLAQAGTPRAARAIYYRRTAVLIALGLFNAYVLLWPADILFVYGLAGLCLYPLRALRTPLLLAVALAALAVPVTLRSLEIAELRRLEAAAQEGATGAAPSATAQAAVEAWETKLRKARPDPADPETAADIRTLQKGSFAEIFVHQAGVSLILQTIVAFKWWFLDALAMMIIGMVLCRAGLFTGQAPAGWLTALVVGGFAVGLPLSAWQTQSLLATQFHPVQVEITKLGYDARRLAMALGYLGLVLLLCRAGAGQGARRRLAAVGRMALTNYLAQSILCGLVFYGFGLGLYGRLTGYELYGVVLAVWSVQIAWSPWWLGRFGIGPFEWAWRSLSYRSVQPWRRAYG
jgi:uncharacterized protein